MYLIIILTSNFSSLSGYTTAYLFSLLLHSGHFLADLADFITHFINLRLQQFTQHQKENIAINTILYEIKADV